MHPVALQNAGQILHLCLRLLEIGTLALTQFTGVLNALFDPRDLGAGTVEARLNGAERIGLRGLIGTDLFDLGLDFPQIREHCMQRSFARFGCRVPHPRLGVQALQSQRQQFRLQLALLVLERLVAARRGRLALQVTDLLLDFLAQIVQTVQILARLADPILGLAAPLLVARDARRFFEKCPQIVRPRFDHTRDHALLDDGIAARA